MQKNNEEIIRAETIFRNIFEENEWETNNTIKPDEKNKNVAKQVHQQNNKYTLCLNQSIFIN